MTAPASAAGRAEGVEGLRWLLTRLVAEVPGLRSVAVVSADGFPLLASDACAPAVSAPARARGPRDAAGDLAGVVSALASLTGGAARLMDAGRVKQTMVAMADGHLVVMSISDGSLLGVRAAPDADLGIVSYHMALFAARAGRLLTPELRAELRTRRGGRTPAR